MKISTILIGLVLISSLFVGMYAFSTSLANSYGVTVDQTYVQAFDKTNELNNEINQSYSNIQDLSANTGSSVQIITLVPDVLIILKNMVVLPFTVVGAMISSLAQFLSLPAWAVSMFLTIATIVLMMAVVNAILGRQT